MWRYFITKAIVRAARVDHSSAFTQSNFQDLFDLFHGIFGG